MASIPPGHDAWIVGNDLLSGSTSPLPYSGSTTNSKMKSGSAVKALGEIALRVNNLERMKRFYQEVLGFEVLGEFPTAALLKIAAGYAGHTQVLGLFDRSVSVDQERTTVDHIAFTIGLPDYDSERKRLETLGLNVEVQEHQWINWRSLYFQIQKATKSNWFATTKI
jgi:catechol-2,3-dioxygenase